MSVNVTATQIVQFKNNLELSLQQTRPKLWPHLTEESASGRLSELTNLIGPVPGQEIDERHGETKYNNTPHDRRWVAKRKPYTYADLVDSDDKLRAGIDLQGAYVRAGTATINRGYDERFLQGFYGVAQTGETGSTLVSFPAGNIIAANVGAGTATGMNVEKLIVAKQRFMANEVDLDEEELYVALTSVQYGELLRDLRATSRDFVSQQQMTVIESGKLPMLLGFNFIQIEYGNAASFPLAAPLSVDGSGYRRVPVWCKSGMAGGMWEKLFASIDTLPGRNHSTQVYARMDVAAARTQEGKCLQILCAE